MTITVAQFFVLLAVAAAFASLFGMLFAASVAGRIVKAHLPAMPEFIAAGQINLTADVTNSDDKTTSRLVMNTTAVELTSLMVERWLDKRGLMMLPKGKDFTVPLKGSHAGN